MATISTPQRRLTFAERAAKNLDHAAIAARRHDDAARQTVERITALRRIVFDNAARANREIEALTGEPEAARLFIRAIDNADRPTALGILKAAIDNRWGDVTKAGARHFGNLPIQELWDLTQSHPEV